MSGIGAIITAGQSQAASATETNAEITAAATKLVLLNRHRCSQSTHKTSEQYQMRLQRVTTTGTGTAYTPLLKEPNGGAVSFTVKIDLSVEPTYTASTVLQLASWNSLTGRDIVLPPGQEFYLAPSALWGVAVITPAATTTMTPNVEVEVTELG